MANLNIKFNNKSYSIDPASLADATASLEAHFVALNGGGNRFVCGDKIQDGNLTYIYQGMETIEEWRNAAKEELVKQSGMSWEEILGGADESAIWDMLGITEDKFSPKPPQWSVYSVSINATGSIQIASECEGYPVLSIADNSIKNCTNITSVIIPTSITKIMTTAFIDCTNLQEIIFEGTTSQWETVEKATYWITNSCPVRYVQCSDGQVAI